MRALRDIRRLGPRARDERPRVLQVEPVAVPQALREGPRLPQGELGQLGPGRPDRARERAGARRRHLRPLGRRRRQEEADPVVLQDHRLRRPPARRPQPARGLVADARCSRCSATGSVAPIGADVDFDDRGPRPSQVTVFTTRPDTLYGATFMVVAPDSDLAAELAAGATPEVQAAFAEYLVLAQKNTEIERQDATREKTGVSLGRFAINPRDGRAHPDLDRRLRARRLRPRRRHGRARARPARPRLRPQVRPAGARRRRHERAGHRRDPGARARRERPGDPARRPAAARPRIDRQARCAARAA